MNKTDVMRTVLEAVLIAVAIFGLVNERKVATWESRTLLPLIKRYAKAGKRALREALRKNKRLMNWLEEPSLSEQIYNDFPHDRITVNTDWRNHQFRNIEKESYEK